MDNESTPIESVQIDEIEKSHQSEAEAALAELSGGGSPEPIPPPAQTMIHNQPVMGNHSQIMEEEPTITSDDQDTFTDTLLQLLLTAVVVAVAVFICFSPKVRIFLEPVIGTGYIALGIRAVLIGVLSIVPSLVFL